MGIFFKPAGEHLLKKSKAMERIDREPHEEIFDRKAIYSGRVSHEMQTEALFAHDGEGAEVKTEKRIPWLAIGVTLGVIYIIVMILLTVL